MKKSFLLCLIAACGSDSNSETPPDAGAPAPLYAIESLVFDEQGSTSYVSLIGSLAVQPIVELADAREFPGYAPADPLGGKIIVGSGEEPVLTRYAVDGAGGWTEEARVSFASYASSSLEASLYVGADKAYAPFESTNFVVWNPASFTVVKELGAPAELPLVDGELKAHRGYGHELRGTTIFQPYYWADASFHRYSAGSKISVIDTATDQVSALLDVPCPHLHITSQDADGNLYFSNGQGSIAPAVLDASQPKNCFAKIAAGAASVAAEDVVHFADLADGREGSNFFHVADGIGFFNVYHAERDPTPDPTDFAAIDYSSSYHLWTLDLDTMQAAPMEGIDYAGGQYVAFRIDGEMIVAIPSGDYSTTAVYAITPAGKAEKRFDVEGWAFKMFRVR